jgi:transposase
MELEHTTEFNIFCGRRNDRIKAIIHEKDRFVLLYKRLDNDLGRCKWSHNRDEEKTSHESSSTDSCQNLKSISQRQ